MRGVFSSSIGRKAVMAITGLFLFIFLIVHLGGNLLLLKQDSGAAFNTYAEILESSILIRISEFILIFGFLFHIIEAILLTIKNKKARPIGYAVVNASANSTWASRNMDLTGSVIFVFLVIHLKSFTIDNRLMGANETMYQSVITAFSSWWYCLIYIISIIFLGIHLRHGVQSAFQSLGISYHNKLFLLFHKIIKVLTIGIIVSFIIIPVIIYFKQI
ncbi:succinate dehydrogenase / fumarate reductase cytochrome b subunit [Pedobacter sp. CG_S7]|uniref:succinate dehydrogenase cytochrome b subunit n=1 Tax=Pedobacter sp. CG_S7 TaxID=3143930 RepID=UPI00339847E6